MMENAKIADELQDIIKILADFMPADKKPVNSQVPTMKEWAASCSLYSFQLGRLTSIQAMLEDPPPQPCVEVKCKLCLGTRTLRNLYTNDRGKDRFIPCKYCDPSGYEEYAQCMDRKSAKAKAILENLEENDGS